MTDSEVFVLEKAWTAQTERVWKIEFERIEVDIDSEHFYFRFTCTPNEGDPFIFTPQVSRRLLGEMGIDPETKMNLVFRLTAGQGLMDIKTRLNSGHDHNYNGLPYCKTYTMRDAEKFKKFLPKAKP